MLNYSFKICICKWTFYNECRNIPAFWFVFQLCLDYILVLLRRWIELMIRSSWDAIEHNLPWCFQSILRRHLTNFLWDVILILIIRYVCVSFDWKWSQYLLMLRHVFMNVFSYFTLNIIWETWLIFLQRNIPCLTKHFKLNFLLFSLT